MLKCEHCGESVEKYQTRNEHICKSCYNRRNKMRCLGQEYIKILDLPEKEREETLKRRHLILEGREKAAKKKDNKKQIIQTKEKHINNKNPEKQNVLNEIIDVFKEQNIPYPLENKSIVPIFRILKGLLDNYISPYLIAEDLMNKLESDYKHAKEFYSTKYSNSVSEQDKEKYLKLKTTWENRHNALLEYRRDIKNVIMEYSKGGILFTQLSKDEDFMTKFNTYYENLMNLADVIEEKQYRAELSKLVVEDEEFCIGFKTEVAQNGKSKYQVSIKTFYGKSVSTFTRIVWAQSESEAKREVYEFLNNNPNKFRFTFNDKDTVVIRLPLNYHSDEN